MLFEPGDWIWWYRQIGPTSKKIKAIFIQYSSDKRALICAADYEWQEPKLRHVAIENIQERKEA